MATKRLTWPSPLVIDASIFGGRVFSGAALGDDNSPSKWVIIGWKGGGASRTWPYFNAHFDPSSRLRSGKIAKHHHYHFKGRSAPLVWKLRKLTTVSVTDVVNSPRGRFPRISTFVFNVVYRQTGLIFHLCVKPTAVCILCAHWADHKILVSGDWPDRKRLVNRDCPSEGCDRRPGTTPHQRPCRDLLKRYSNLLKQYSNLLKQYSNDFNSFLSALHWLETVTNKQDS